MVEMVEVSHFTEFLMDQLQIVALLFMATVYLIRVAWILRFKAIKETTPSRGNEKEAIVYAFATLAMPWEMESTRTKWYLYAEFVMYHLGAGICILSTFLLPYPALRWMISFPFIISVMRVIALAAFLVGLHRLYRRLADPAMKLISTKDDIFSLALLQGWLLAAFFALPQQSEFWLVIFFGFTTFFLFYVPFSKISHYVYWFFMRYYMGKHFGHRGTWPRKTADKGMIDVFNRSTTYAEEHINVR